MFLLEFSSRIRVNIPNCVEEVIREDEEGALYMYSCSDLPIASLDLVSKAVEGQYLVAVIPSDAVEGLGRFMDVKARENFNQYRNEIHNLFLNVLRK